MTVRLLPLERIVASKRFIRRPKDLAHLPILEEVIWARKHQRAAKKRVGRSQ
jgi:hypothetical protein